MLKFEEHAEFHGAEVGAVAGQAESVMTILLNPREILNWSSYNAEA